jgi:hypothetical protein
MYTEEIIKRIAKRNDIDISKFDIKELVMGMEVELEHGSLNSKTDITGDDPEATFKIVMAHMSESPNYYSKLKKMESLTNESKRFMALAGIKEGDKKFITNESFQETTQVDEGEDEDNFIIHEFEQTQVEPGEDDELYKIKMPEKED